jgi:excisionase family DNA binding protein
MRRRLKSPREEQTQEVQTEASAVGRLKKKARKAVGLKLEVLKIGGCSRDAIKQARDYSTPRRIMTAAEVAEYLRVHQSTIYKMTAKGQIPFFRIGFDYRFHRDAIDKWMTDGTSEVLKKKGAAVRAAPKKNRDST